MASLKEEKEAFVTGHIGTTPWEVLLVCLSVPIGLACYGQLVVGMTKTTTTTTTTLVQRWKKILLEAMSIWFPIVLCQTVYLYPYGVGLLVLQTILAALVKTTATTTTTENDQDNDQEHQGSKSRPRLEYLTVYRSCILYLTFVAILAVDFHVFPRRFAKTEISGYGLMDVGAASFSLSAGLVSREARGKTSNPVLSKQLFHTLPLIAIGVVRIITNKSLEYQEHVSEYGVHWNFFFTMGVLAILPPILHKLTTPKPTWILPAVIMCSYQGIGLSWYGLQDYIETAPRNCANLEGSSTFCINFLTANREGILGCLGYLSLYLFGEWVGYQYLWMDHHQSGKSSPSSSSSLMTLAGFLWLVLLVTTNVLSIKVSRRSTNLSFCTWAAAHNLLLLGLIRWTTSTTKAVPLVFDTVNRYGLWMFLIANLLTGLVNLTIPTLQVTNLYALFIVFAYICTVGIIALLIDSLVESIGVRKGTVAPSPTQGRRHKRS